MIWIFYTYGDDGNRVLLSDAFCPWVIYHEAETLNASYDADQNGRNSKMVKNQHVSF